VRGFKVSLDPPWLSGWLVLEDLIVGIVSVPREDLLLMSGHGQELFVCPRWLDGSGC